MHEIYIIMQMYALELSSSIIKLLTNTGIFSHVCSNYDAIPFFLVDLVIILLSISRKIILILKSLIIN